MLIDQAQQLEKGQRIVDSERNHFRFVGLDDQNDLIVECRAAINGTIVLDRAACSLWGQPSDIKDVEYDCDYCGIYVPDGNGLYLNDDARVCVTCHEKHWGDNK